MLDMIEHIRAAVGKEVELLHDVHERLQPIHAVQFAKDVEQFKLFFLEDALAPEDIKWFETIRQQCSTPLAMGELFSNPREWQPLISGRLIDFVRMHISQMGGLTPARDVALFANMYGIRTAWHGPGDTSPVGHAANLHLDVWAPNFGVQEWCRFPELVYEMFPGLQKFVMVTCIPMIAPAWVLTLTRNWRPSTPARIRWKRGLRHVCRTAALPALETWR
jgi:mannonate dehydratase